ncbi:MAG: hypothetical protein U9Q79_10520, partial [Candidatus Hydrogenedentes bacterium]|nr:hypothetical protein [Candidatus Hydrogenedentota bacterium]
MDTIQPDGTGTLRWLRETAAERDGPLDETSPFPVIRVDGGGWILGANEAARETFGPLVGDGARLEGLLPDSERLGLPETLATGRRQVFCAKIGDRRWQLTLVADAEREVGYLYGQDISAYEDIARQAGRIKEEHQRQQKELLCIYGLAEAICMRETAQEICRDVVNLIPEAWRYPEHARARIVLDGEEYVSQPFEMTRWGQSAVIMAEG